jgi:hypothetical protein
MNLELDPLLRVRAAVAATAPHATSFNDLVAVASGMYPTTVMEVAQSLQADGMVIPGRALVPDRRIDWEPGPSHLPLPHPLDFEWRFAEESCPDLLNYVDSASLGSSDRLALLGTPSLAERLATLGTLSQRSVTLFERRDEACLALAPLVDLHIKRGDVAQTSASLDELFDAVIADPPWYEAVILTFLQAAAGMLRPGGVALFCLPSLATRPGVVHERASLLARAHEFGFEAEHLIPAAVGYESPLFERAALRAAGMPNFDPFWRRGDVLLLRNLARLPGGRIVSPHAEKDEAAGWHESTCGMHRVRVHLGSAPAGSTQSLVHLVDGDVLPTVSVRDPRRALANVWTTTNRIYETDRPDLLLDALRKFSLEAQGEPAVASVASSSHYESAARLIWTAESDDLDFRGV